MSPRKISISCTRKSVEVDQNVSVGQNLLTLVSLQDIWVTANFKETQLRHMLASQKVGVHVDSTGKDYSGKVTQVGGATGSVLSLFPPENATGNYVKVVQRVPVRIDFTNLAKEDPNHELRPGLSVEPKVWVQVKSTQPPASPTGVSHIPAILSCIFNTMRVPPVPRFWGPGKAQTQMCQSHKATDDCVPRSLALGDPETYEPRKSLSEVDRGPASCSFAARGGIFLCRPL